MTGSLAAGFSLKPEEALRFFRAKGLRTTFDWRDMLHEEHDASFTVAKMLDLDLLGDVKAMVDQAITEGRSLQWFKDNLRPLLIERGWWGRQVMTDPASGETQEVQLGSSRRLKVIYDTNLRTAHAAGHWEKIVKNAKTAPYLMYVAVDDDRTRAAHRAWSHRVLHVDDPWWLTHFPPNGWNCRCSVIQLGGRDLEKMGLSPDDIQPAPTHDWENPRTGEVLQVPQGVDPGFGYQPGRRADDGLMQTQIGKLEAADEDLARGYLKGLVKSPVFGNWMQAPEGMFPLARLAEADAAKIGAETTVARLSAEIVRQHPSLTAADYASAQDAITKGQAIQDSSNSVTFRLNEGGDVIEVQATERDKSLYITSVRRIKGGAL